MLSTARGAEGLKSRAPEASAHLSGTVNQKNRATAGHKVAGINEAIAAKCAEVPLPAALTVPISTRSRRLFAKFKAARRKAAERTREALWQAIGRTLDFYPPQQCRDFFNQAGYNQAGYAT